MQGEAKKDDKSKNKDHSESSGEGEDQAGRPKNSRDEWDRVRKLANTEKLKLTAQAHLLNRVSISHTCNTCVIIILNC